MSEGRDRALSAVIGRRMATGVMRLATSSRPHAEMLRISADSVHEVDGGWLDPIPPTP